MVSEKLTYRFSECDASMKDLLGGKGAGLGEMSKIGLPVPPGFVIPTSACLTYLKKDKWPDGLWTEVKNQIEWLGNQINRKFGDLQNPLLLSVRSGAKVSMPGMMDTILNLGINDEIVLAISKQTNNERFALDSYRRFIQKFAEIVLDVAAEPFENILEQYKLDNNLKTDQEFSPELLKKIIHDFKEITFKKSGKRIPEDPFDQLYQSIEAVFRSWNNSRAVFYRNYHEIPHSMGTAVNIMTMVYGNMGEDSGTGVLFTRNPATGEKAIFGEYLTNAQGEDVVAGIRTPQNMNMLSETSPDLHQKIVQIANLLENHYKDVQDVEFTVERGILYMLQTRSAKRNATAAIKIAVDMVKEKLIDKAEALQRVPANELTQLFVAKFSEKSLKKAAEEERIIAKGFAASPGAATGIVTFEADEAVKLADKGEKVILVRPETNPDDVHGILNSVGILTSRGGVTSHAAVVTRGLGKPCIVGCESIKIDLKKKNFIGNNKVINEGDRLSINGTTGEVIIGEMETEEPLLDDLKETNELLQWADETRKLEVWANADTEEDSKRAIEMGAEGIGLCRTEHMFLGPERVPLVQELFFNAQQAHEWYAKSKQNKKQNIPNEVNKFENALNQLEKLQINDFISILSVMENKPVVIRLLDAPLHEFLPNERELLEKIYNNDDTAKEEEILKRLTDLKESNPMLGHRGCRVGITYPKIYEMQVRAITTAACVVEKKGKIAKPEIMIPLVAHFNELKILRERLLPIGTTFIKQANSKIKLLFGTMIEVPRAALTAKDIAEYADFFSFGTNDLTQTTFGFSRDDAEGKFLNYYLENEVLETNPFGTLDQNGVGQLIEFAVKNGQKTNSKIELGICGEHGGEEKSIAFCHNIGLNYVSCSPFRVPVARLAAAQAVLTNSKK